MHTHKPVLLRILVLRGWAYFIVLLQFCLYVLAPLNLCITTHVSSKKALPFLYFNIMPGTL